MLNEERSLGAVSVSLRISEEKISNDANLVSSKSQVISLSGPSLRIPSPPKSQPVERFILCSVFCLILLDKLHIKVSSCLRHLACLSKSYPLPTRPPHLFTPAAADR